MPSSIWSPSDFEFEIDESTANDPTQTKEGNESHKYCEMLVKLF